MSGFAGNKKLSSDFRINFENINKTNINIIKELEKRAAFTEECAKLLLNDFVDFSFFVSILENEKSKMNFSSLKNSMIDENVFLCEYIFKSISFTDLYSAYLEYLSTNPRTVKNIDVNKNINMKINLTEQFSFNDFQQYMTIFNFNIINFNYNNTKNSISLVFEMPEIKEKENRFAVFYGLLEYCGVNDIVVINAE